MVKKGDKLAVVAPAALIQRHACKGCGVYMYGPVTRKHPFQALDFIYPERFEEEGWQQPGFAAFVSSAIEGGVEPSAMDAVRARFKELEMETYDCLNPALMDYIATWTVQNR